MRVFRICYLGVFAFAFVTGSAIAAEGDFAWAIGAGSSTGNDVALGTAVDADGNVYLAGYFNGTVDFDPGPGTTNVTSAGGEDIFILKLDSSGSFVWVRTIGGTGDDRANGIALDASGNPHIAGSFSDTVDFDPEGGTHHLTSSGTQDAYVCKLSSAGALVWAGAFHSSSSGPLAHGITVDTQGNVITTGIFGLTADFDPGPGTANLTHDNFSDVFVSKLDANGAFVWAKAILGPTSNEGHAVTSDDNDAVCITGSFTNTTDFDPGAGTYHITAPSGSSDQIFVCKLDASGNFVWAGDMGGTNADRGVAIDVDNAGNVWTTGYFHNGSADFDPGAGVATLSAGASLNIFVCKWDAGRNFVWAGAFGDSGADQGFGIDTDVDGAAYVTGRFAGTVDFDPGPGVFNLATGSSINLDAFIMKVDASGNFQWAKQIGGASSDYGQSIFLGENSAIHVAGLFRDTVDFDPGAGTFDLTAAGSSDFFALQLQDGIAPEVVDIALVGPGGTTEDTIQFIVTFSECVTGVDASDFVIDTIGNKVVTGAAITGVTGSCDTYTVTVDTGTGTGPLSIDLVDDDSISDSAGNLLGGAGLGNGDFDSGEVASVLPAVGWIGLVICTALMLAFALRTMWSSRQKLITELNHRLCR